MVIRAQLDADRGALGPQGVAGLDILDACGDLALCSVEAGDHFWRRRRAGVVAAVGASSIVSDAMATAGETAVRTTALRTHPLAPDAQR
jgi:hypothetical protein